MQIDQNKVSPGVVLTPTLGLSGELVITVCIWIIAFSGLIGKGRTIGQFMSIFLMVFVGACVTVLNNRHWISKSLSLSWQRDYERSANLIEEIQYEFSCKGYYSTTDRAANIAETFQMPCNSMLIQRFGPQLYHVALFMLLVRLVQLVGS